MASVTEKRAAFRKLHESGCFVLPNPWDQGSAKYLAASGFKALATTSAGFAWSHGLPDGKVSVEQVLAHVAELTGAIDLPLNVDFEAGFSDTPEGIGKNVAACVAAGASGLSIEDYTGDPAKGLFSIEDGVARIRAARAQVGDAILTGRSEGLLRRTADLDETIKRLRAYAEAGADCLYAPGLTTPEQISAVVKAVVPKPVNLLIQTPSLTVAEITALGVRRISLGGALAVAAWAGFVRTVKDIAGNGSFATLGDIALGREVAAALQ